MKTNKNSFMDFFSSIRLTLFTLFFLAVTSIIGTVIPQGEPAQFYINTYGPTWATLFQIFSVPTMYTSWWFVFFLTLLSVNLVVCTIDRFPGIWGLVKADILSQEPARVEKMSGRRSFVGQAAGPDAAALISSELTRGGWKPRQAERDGAILIGGQKGPWTRLGVLAVHTSIIVIFIGAIIGSVFGFKASVMIPEGAATDRVYAFGSAAQIPLGFQVRCDEFKVEFYDNGAPKEYLSVLTVIENGRELFSRSIEVNDPLDHRGLTFYQSSYEGYNEYLVHLKDLTTGEEQQFLIPPYQQIPWGDEIVFGIINMAGRGQMGGNQFKIWFTDNKAEASTFWLKDGEATTLTRPATNFSISIKQRFATGLQVTKDPGVWYVYAGCGLMILGLIIAFFLSHRRVWVVVREGEGSTKVVLAGSANKNKLGMEKELDTLAAALRNNAKLNLIEE